jgi:hypothetical protein
MIDKNNLLRKSHYNELLSHFYPNQFYTLKDLDLTLTKDNKIKPTSNLSRSTEGIFSTETTPMFTFSLDKLSELYKSDKLESCHSIIKTSLENVLNYFLIEKLPVKEKIEKAYFSGKLKYSTMGFCLKIVDLLEEQIKRYRVKRNLDMTFPSTEVFYRRTEKQNIEESKIN